MKKQPAEATCPRCGSERISGGRCLGQLDLGGGFVFRPEGIRHFASSGTDVRIAGHFTGCMDCGLLWSTINKEKLKKVLSKQGKKAVRNKLGLE